VARLDEYDSAAMHERRHEPYPGVMTGVYAVVVLRFQDPQQPAFETGFLPRERTLWSGLLALVHDKRVMSMRATEVIPPLGLRGIATGSRIDEERFAERA